jgi:hypothetical protein
VVAVVGLRLGGGDLEAESLTAQEEIHDTGVSNGREALLLLDVVGNICGASVVFSKASQTSNSPRISA